MTTLLTILMVVVIVGVIFLWNKSSVSNVQGEADRNKICSEIDFISGDFCYESGGNTRINFHIRNDGNISIKGFSILLIDNAGNSVPISALIGSGTGSERKVTSDFFSNSGNIDKIKISPEISFNQEIFICPDNEKTLFWNELKLC